MGSPPGHRSQVFQQWDGGTRGNSAPERAPAEQGTPVPAHVACPSPSPGTSGPAGITGVSCPEATIVPWGHCLVSVGTTSLALVGDSRVDPVSPSTLCHPRATHTLGPQRRDVPSVLGQAHPHVPSGAPAVGEGPRAPRAGQRGAAPAAQGDRRCPGIGQVAAGPGG